MNVRKCPGKLDCQQPLPEDTFEGARIGDGAANTNAILAECTTNDIAANLCRDLGDDWFLPSRGELNLMYTNLHKNVLGGFAADLYWSSTESRYLIVWGQNFNGGVLLELVKPDKRNVRAARAF